MKITGVLSDYETLDLDQVHKKSILDEAKEIIYGDREKTYGRPEKNLQLIAEYWTAHLNARFGEEGLPAVALTPDDVCLMMVALKVARLANDPKHRDSQADGCGYFALMERIQTRSNTTNGKEATEEAARRG